MKSLNQHLNESSKWKSIRASNLKVGDVFSYSDNGENPCKLTSVHSNKYAVEAEWTDENGEKDATTFTPSENFFVKR